MVDDMYPYHDDPPTTSFPVARTEPRMLGRRARIAVAASAATLLIAAGVGIGLFATESGEDMHEAANATTQLQAATGHRDAGAVPAGPVGRSSAVMNASKRANAAAASRAARSSPEWTMPASRTS